MEELILKDVKFNGEHINSWEFVGNSRWRLYFKKNEKCDEKNGFSFMSVHWCGSKGESPLWDISSTDVECSFNGTAYFDGVRHIYFGTDQDEDFGYINYPNLTDFIDVLKEIERLVSIYCKEDK